MSALTPDPRPRRGVRRGLLVALGALLLAVVLAGAWAAWTAWHVRADLSAASDSAHRLRTALTHADQDAAEAELAELQEQTAAAADGTSSPIWTLAEHMPALGDDARAVATVTATLADLTAEGLPPIVDSAGDLGGGSFTPSDGRLPVAAIEELQGPLAQAGAAFADADAGLAQVDDSGLVDAVRRPLQDLRDQVSTADDTLAAASRAANLLPGMLGGDGERRFLVVFQNNAEVRSTGGMPGAMSLVETREGGIAMTRQMAASDFPRLTEPVLPLTTDEQTVFGDQLGEWMHDTNFTPDFPRAAELMAAHWRRQFGQDVDGVVSIDPVALSYLLTATGPVTIDGVELTADNAVDELLNGTYLRLEDPAAQDEFFRHVARGVFDAVMSGPGSPSELVSALARGADEHRLLVHSFDADEQDQLAGTTVAGEFPTDAGTNPQVGVYLNDATGSKMSYYLDYAASAASSSCESGTQGLTGRLTIASTAPADAKRLPLWITGGGAYGVPAGDQIVVADLYGPVGGTLAQVRIDGKRAHAKPQSFDGRPVASIALYLTPGQSLDVTWVMASGPDQAGDIEVAATPGVRPEAESSVATSACR